MKRLSKAWLPATVIGTAVSIYACGAGVSTGVYVGVAVPGPYVGYPGVGYPGYVGRPPYVYEEDALNLPGSVQENVALSTDSRLEPYPRCRLDPPDAEACAAEERENRTSGPIGEASHRSGGAEASDR